MSIREELMESFEEFIGFMNLNAVYSGSGLSKDKKYRYVLFNKPLTVDGEIRIYGPNFIGIKWKTTFRDLPRNGWKVFRTPNEAKEFIMAAFVNLDMDVARSML